jgi:type I restriction enzyme, S subunit
MEVLQDTYKDTKIGRIPKDWDCKPMNDFVINFRGGASFKPSEFSNEGVKVLSKIGVRSSGVMTIPYSKQQFCEEVCLKKYAKSIATQSELVTVLRDLVPSGPSIGYIVKIPDNSVYIMAQGVYCFSVDENKINQNFLIQLSNTNWYRKYMQKILVGSTQVHIRGPVFLKTPLPIPPLPEQQKIAAILSTVDEQISTTDKIIEKSKELKKGLMQKLFSEGIGHTEFKDTKIGRIPKEWNTLKINQVADCYGGTTPSTVVEEYWNGDILWATPSDITKNKSEYLLNTSRKITEQGRASKNLRFVKKNGLLMTSRASIGFLNISNGDVVTNQGFINIECKDNFHYKFFYYWVLDNRKKLLSLSQGSTFLELYRKTFAKINIPTPPLAEQQKIAAILSEADAKIEMEQTQKTQLEQLKKGLMQQLLTGKKRVKV